MSERIEKIMREYPQMQMQLKALSFDLNHFKGIGEDEMIGSMVCSHSKGERVQTSRVSDKTARVAVAFREEMERVNDEWYDYLFQSHMMLKEEIDYFEYAVSSLSGYLSGLIADMVMTEMTWDELAGKYNISRAMVGKCRKKAIKELEIMYLVRDKQIETYILS